MKRVFDLSVGMIVLMFVLVPMLIVAIGVKISSKGTVLYWSDRVGRDNVNFKMPKFRTMKLDTPEMATHLMDTNDTFLYPLGRFLRRSSFDEIPQLWSILKGDMSFVGPRPALFNQDDLVELRTKKRVERLTPGLTGWAQVNGRDELSIPEKVALDVEYLKRQSFGFDMKILWLTFLKVLAQDSITH